MNLGQPQNKIIEKIYGPVMKIVRTVSLVKCYFLTVLTSLFISHRECLTML